jgi:signal transduction histidine kinase
MSARWRAWLTDPRAHDAALVLVCLILTVLAVKGRWSPLPRPVLLVAGVAGSVAQWWRRRRPLVAVTVAAGTFALSGNPGPWLVGVYSAAAYTERGWLGSVVPGYPGLLAVLWLAAGRPQLLDVVGAAVATIVVSGTGRYQRTRRALLDSARTDAAHLSAERLWRDEQARVAERTRIAREMHDVLAHKVSLIALHAGALEVGAGTDAERVQQVAGLIRGTAREALQELRVVLGVLNGGADPPALTGAESDLAGLVEESTRAGQRVELRDRAGPLPPAVARVVYRVAQEGLTNAHRYAPDAPVTISVDRDGTGRVVITVANPPGTGTPPDLPGSGSGLVGLAERIRLVGGELSGGPVEAGGWQLRAVVPWPP